MSEKHPTTKVQDLVFYEETGIVYTQFTDGGSAAGTYQVKFELPVGFYVERTQLLNLTGFANDTTAAITVGDGSDVDRYNTGTPSVLTTLGALDLGVASGVRFLATANRPTVTVTGGADFTSINAGGFDIRIYGWKP